MSKWNSTYLGDISVISYGYTAKADAEIKGPKFLRITDIQDGKVDWDTVPSCEISGEDYKKYRLEKNDIVFARTGATTGKSFRIDDVDSAVAASYLIRVRLTDKNILPEFVHHFFNTPKYWEAVNLGITGSTQGGFNASKLGGLLIPIPPISEQKRIVEILDEAFEGIDAAIANTQINLANTREIFKCYLNIIFKQKSDGWDHKSLGELGKVSMCKRVLKEQTSPSGDIPFYKIGTFGKEPDAFISDYLYNSFREKYSFPKTGDVLISASGTIGRRVIYDGAPAYFQDSNIIWIDNNETLVLNEYLYHFYGVCDWNPSKGATISRLYNDDLRKINISFPNIQEQKKLIEIMDELNRQTQNLEVVYQQKLIALRELKQSLLQKAFRGELTSGSDALAEVAA